MIITVGLEDKQSKLYKRAIKLDALIDTEEK